VIFAYQARSQVHRETRLVEHESEKQIDVPNVDTASDKRPMYANSRRLSKASTLNTVMTTGLPPYRLKRPGSKSVAIC
jgi:hypothetical protein